MDIEEFFDVCLDDVPYVNEKIKKDDFIKKTKDMLQLMLDFYSKCHYNKYVVNEDDEDYEECGRCHGFMFIEQGGVGDVECPNCNGTGLNTTYREFDSEGFLEFIEHEVMFGKQPFLNLLTCQIEEDTNKTIVSFDIIRYSENGYCSDMRSLYVNGFVNFHFLEELLTSEDYLKDMVDDIEVGQCRNVKMKVWEDYDDYKSWLDYEIIPEDN